jgi:hypothetical protein
VNVPPLEPGEPLSPELVLVLPPELRAQVLAGLPLPVRPAPRPRVPAVSPAARHPVRRPVGRILDSRIAQLALIFAAITVLTLAMSVVAQAFR